MLTFERFKLRENPFRIEPAINYRFSSMTSPEKLTFMKYNYAIDLDRRTFMEIYMGCVKMSQLVMNFIYIPYYHNMKFLKLYLAVFVANLNILTTTIFYSHYYIGKMYAYKFLMCSIQSIFISVMLYLFSYSKKKFTSVVIGKNKVTSVIRNFRETILNKRYNCYYSDETSFE